MRARKPNPWGLLPVAALTVACQSAPTATLPVTGVSRPASTSSAPALAPTTTPAPSTSTASRTSTTRATRTPKPDRPRPREATVPRRLRGAWNGGPGDGDAYSLVFTASRYVWTAELGAGSWRDDGIAVVGESSIRLISYQGPEQLLGWRLEKVAGRETLRIVQDGVTSTYVRE